MLKQTSIQTTKRPETKTGHTLSCTLKQHPQQRYLLYIPQSAHADTPLVITVHGISRNAREQIEQFRAWAERYQAILLAPLFTKSHFRDFQRLGRVGRGPRADLALEQMIIEATSLTGSKCKKTFMFGYSGGGQFAHRYAMAWPHKVARIAIGAAGWYTYPDLTRKYPYGVRETDALPGLVFDPIEFLKVPALVMVGEWDNERDSGLNQARHIDQRQGKTRIERAKRWTETMKNAAASYGFTTNYRFEVLPTSGHSFMENMQRGNMGKQVFEYFFEHQEE